MQKFNGNLIRQFPSASSGNAANGVQVSVCELGTNTLIDIYGTNNELSTPIANPITTDAKGFYSFYAPDGKYTLRFNNGFPALEINMIDAAAWAQIIEDVGGVLFEQIPKKQGPAAISSLAGGVFDITEFSYVTGQDRVLVFADGVKLELGADYTESSSTSITLTPEYLAAADPSTKIEVWSVDLVPTNNIKAGDVSYDNSTTGLPASSVQQAIDEISSAVGNQTIFLVKMPSYDAANINAALAEAFALLPSGGVVQMPAGDITITGSFSLPQNVTLSGQGQFATRMLRTSDTYSVTMQTASQIRDMQLFTSSGGNWVLIPASTQYQKILSASIRTSGVRCIGIAADGGEEMEVTGCNLGSGSQAVPCISLDGVDSAARPRHFNNNSGSGSPVYDFSGMNDTFVSGGYTLGFFSNASTSKPMITNLRVGSNPNLVNHPIYGENVVIDNCVFSGAVTLYCTDSRIDAICSDYNFIDLGSGNSVEIRGRNYTPVWTATVTNPSIGNGTLSGRYSRSGGVVTVSGQIVIGSTTTTGSGIWRISLPITALSLTWDQPVAGIFEAVGAGKPFQYQGSCIIPTSNRDVIEFRYIDERQNFVQKNTGSEVTAASNKIILSGYSYQKAVGMAQVYQNGQLLSLANGDYDETFAGGVGVDFTINTTIAPSDVFLVVIPKPAAASVVGGTSSNGDTWPTSTRLRFNFSYFCK